MLRLKVGPLRRDVVTQSWIDTCISSKKLVNSLSQHLHAVIFQYLINKGVRLNSLQTADYVGDVNDTKSTDSSKLQLH